VSLLRHALGPAWQQLTDGRPPGLPTPPRDPIRGERADGVGALGWIIGNALAGAEEDLVIAGSLGQR